MTRYPVQYAVRRPERFTRLQLAVRVVAFIALGMIGLSFGAVLAFAYLALPVYAASRLSGEDGARYVTEDGPRVIAGLRWLAAVCAWAGLVADKLPGRRPEETVTLSVAASPRPELAGAVARVVTGLPSALVLGLLCWIGGLVWLWAAITVLVKERVGDGAFRYLEGLQRWSVRLLAYQASLVDEYPPFSFDSSPPPPSEERAERAAP
jgi:hypothetical protein